MFSDSYNNWDNFTSPTMLSDDDLDNIFTGTVSNLMYNDSITFLFGYGQNFESVTDECGIYDSDLMINVITLPIRNAEGDSVLTLPTYIAMEDAHRIVRQEHCSCRCQFCGDGELTSRF